MGLIGLRGIGQKERIALNRRSENNQRKHSLQEKKKKAVTSDDCSAKEKISLFISCSVLKEVKGRKKSFHIFMCVCVCVCV